jgi:single-stranded-DNA-specific exonuclease
MMPQEGENKIFIGEGLSSLENSWRPGIRVFFENDFLQGYNFSQKISKIISLLNVRDIENNLPSHFRLLATPFLDEAREIVSKIMEKAKLRKAKIETIIEEIRTRILDKEEPIVFEGDPSFDLSLISSVASHLSQEFKKPIFIFKEQNQESQGTVRTPPGINSVELMKKCKKYLTGFGGHPRASGFRIKNENREKFKDCLIKNFSK